MGVVLIYPHKQERSQKDDLAQLDRSIPLPTPQMGVQKQTNPRGASVVPGRSVPAKRLTALEALEASGGLSLEALECWRPHGDKGLEGLGGLGGLGGLYPREDNCNLSTYPRELMVQVWS